MSTAKSGSEVLVTVVRRRLPPPLTSRVCCWLDWPLGPVGRDRDGPGAPHSIGSVEARSPDVARTAITSRYCDAAESTNAVTRSVLRQSPRITPSDVLHYQDHVNVSCLCPAVIGGRTRGGSPSSCSPRSGRGRRIPGPWLQVFGALGHVQVLRFQTISCCCPLGTAAARSAPTASTRGSGEQRVAMWH